MTAMASSRAGVAALPVTESRAAIRTIGLVKRFGKRLAVDGLDMHVPRGSTYGLIGLNGAGKSTAIRMIMGLLAPTSGRVVMDGMDMPRARAELMEVIGYVPDRPTAYPWMRVREVIAFSRSQRRRWARGVAEDLLERYGLDPSQRVRKLSKGQGAKLSLLLALAHDPEILVLDEPTDGLDPIARDDFLEHVLGSVCDRERTVLMSSHNLDDLQRMTDVVGILHEGRLLVQEWTEGLLASTKRLRVVLGDVSGPVPDQPAGTICARRLGREWTVTVHGSPEGAAETLREASGVESVEVVGCGLDEVFKDHVRGRAGAKELPR